jgi:hypothetical protein
LCSSQVSAGIRVLPSLLSVLRCKDDATRRGRTPGSAGQDPVTIWPDHLPTDFRDSDIFVEILEQDAQWLDPTEWVNSWTKEPESPAV